MMDMSVILLCHYFFSFIITQSNYLENIRAVKVNPQNLQNKIKLKFSEKKNNAHTDRGWIMT